MKKALTVLFTDIHIHLHNEEFVLDSISQIIDVCKNVGVKRALLLGDCFESRKAQPLQCLKSLERVLNMFNDADIELIIIPGNHDKTNYESMDSFLDQYQHFPNITLVRDYYSLDIAKNIHFHFIPYFKEETTYLTYFNKLTPVAVGRHYLFTHIGIDGILNNSGEEVKNPVTKSLFKSFDKVYVGHYHNGSQHGNINYIGSIMPTNFGEDDKKGCTILFDDGTDEFKPLSFQKYIKVSINIDKLDKAQENELILKYSNCKDNIRFEITGDASKIQTLDKSKFEMVGIDVVTKNSEIEETVNTAEFDEFIEFDNKALLSEFDEFCEVNELSDTEIGKDYLVEILNKVK